MNNDFINLLERLSNAGIDFVIVGGFAGVVHGCTYVTQDIDICFEFTEENLLALEKALSDLEPAHRMTPQKKKLKLTQQSIKDLKNLYLITKLGQLDCLSFIDGIGDYNEVKKSSRIIHVGETKMRVLSLDALINTKKVMNRLRDREAIIQLETIKKLKKNPDI